MPCFSTVKPNYVCNSKPTEHQLYFSLSRLPPSDLTLSRAQHLAPSLPCVNIAQIHERPPIPIITLHPLAINLHVPTKLRNPVRTTLRTLSKRKLPCVEVILSIRKLTVTRSLDTPPANKDRNLATHRAQLDIVTNNRRIGVGLCQTVSEVVVVDVKAKVR